MLHTCTTKCDFSPVTSCMAAVHKVAINNHSVCLTVAASDAVTLSWSLGTQQVGFFCERECEFADRMVVRHRIICQKDTRKTDPITQPLHLPSQCNGLFL